MWRVFSRVRTNGYLGVVESPSVTLDMDALLFIKTVTNKSNVVCINDGDKSTVILRPTINKAKRLFSGANCGYESPNGQVIQIPPGQSEIECTGTQAVAPNQPFYLSLMAFKNTAQPDWPVDIRIGFGGWRLLVHESSVYIALPNENWTKVKEYQALSGNEDYQGPREREGEEIINPDAIYDVFQDVDANSDKQDSAVGSYLHLWIIPHPGIGLYVATGENPFNNKKQNIELIELPEWRRSDTVTTGGILDVYARQTAFIVNGYMLQFKPAVLRTPPYGNGQMLDLVGNMQWNISKYEMPETSIAAADYSATWKSFFVKINFQTDPLGYYTPFLYRLSGSKPGGTFVPIPSNGYDSSIDVDKAGNPPIIDVDMTCDGEMRRHTYEVSVRQAGKALAQIEQRAALLENQRCDLTMGLSLGQQNYIINDGIITPCGAYNVAGMDDVHQWTELRFKVHDKWKIAEEQTMSRVMPGDGWRLGKYIKYVLRNIGFGAGEISIDDDTGIVLPRAQFGDQPCVLPTEESSGADYLRDLMDYYGFDLNLYVGADGKWYLHATPETLATVEGVQAIFSSDPNRIRSTTYPGRLAVLAEDANWIRDSGDFYNAIKVEGGEVNGNVLTASYIDYASIYNPAAPNFIGRFKPYQTVRNEAWLSRNIILLVTRSLAMRYAISNRMFEFSTFFHVGLFMNDKISVDGKLCRIKNIGSASIKSDRMSIVAQEIG